MKFYEKQYLSAIAFSAYGFVEQLKIKTYSKFIV